MLDLLIITIFIIWIIQALGNKFDYLSPGFVTIFFFLISTMLLKFEESNWDIEISPKSYAILTVGLLFVVISDLTAKKVRIALHKYNLKSIVDFPVIEERTNNNLRKFLVLVSLVLFVIYAREILRVGGALGVSGLFAIGAANNAFNMADERLSTVAKLAIQFNYLIPFPYIWIFVYNFYKRTLFRKNIINLIPVFCGIFTAFLSSNRHNALRFVFAFVFIALVFYKQRIETVVNDKQRKKILKISVVLVLGFLIFFYLAKDVVKISLHSISIVEYVIYYLSSSVVIFSKFLENPGTIMRAPLYFGDYSFDGFYATLARWGIIENYTLPSRSHVIIGGSSGIRTGNIFTFFSKPYQDFGIIGMIVMTVIIFFIASYIYYHVVSKKTISIKDYRRKMRFTLVLSYFYYVFPIAVADYYLSLDSKIMTVVYIGVMLFISRILIKLYYAE